MKRVLKIALILCILATVLCVAAYAADDAPAGIYAVDVKLDGAKVTPDGTSDTYTIDGHEETVYADAEKMAVEYPSTQSFVLILMTSKEISEGTIPKEEDIYFIDQAVPESGKAVFTVYPKQMQKGSYYIYGAETNGKLTLVAEFKYNQPYILGDVDDDQYITGTDALWALQNAAGNRTFNATQLLAGDVDKDNYITGTDALWMLQIAAGNRKLS